MAQTLMRLKGRGNRQKVALAPGASGPHLPVFSRPHVWSLDGSSFDLRPLSLKVAFRKACDNAGVQLPRSKLMASTKSSGGRWRPRWGAALLALGPLTDAACLLMNYPDTAPHIDFIGALISQLSGPPMQLSGAKGPLPVRDFNMVRSMTAVIDDRFH